MRHVESKKFTFVRPPTGLDIVTLVKDNELHGWSMNIERRITNDLTGMGVNKSVYDVTFEKDVEA